MPHKVVIIGGGFGGVEALQVLQKQLKNKLEITLFNPSTDFIFTPLLHEAATGGVLLSNMVAPIRSFIKGNSQFVCDAVSRIDTALNKVYTEKNEYYYDYLIVATGSQANTYGVPGALEHAFFLKTVEDALALRKRILTNIEKYQLSPDPQLLSFVLIGGGSTGVELALEIDDYIRNTLCKCYANLNISEQLKITIICVSDHVLRGFSPFIQETAMKQLKAAKINMLMNTTAVEITENSVLTTTQGKVEAGTVIWCGGVQSVFPEIVGGIKAEVNESLQLVGSQNVFVLGDCINYGTKVPMDAQAAVQQAQVVAKNIKSAIQNKPLTAFNYRPKGNLLSLGRWNAVGEIGPIKLKGAFAWWVWRTIYLFEFPLLSKRFKIALDWTVSIFSGRDISNL